METQINIPIYRALKLGTKDEWVEGYLVSNSKKRFYYIYGDSNGYEFKEPIDPSTLAIHFPNMIDKNGKKIFASLSEDGVGGDIMKIYGWDYFSFIEHSLVSLFNVSTDEHDGTLASINVDDIKIIGIHKG